jgi:hypothetical protein
MIERHIQFIGDLKHSIQASIDLVHFPLAAFHLRGGTFDEQRSLRLCSAIGKKAYNPQKVNIAVC